MNMCPSKCTVFLYTVHSEPVMENARESRSVRSIGVSARAHVRSGVSPGAEWSAHMLKRCGSTLKRRATELTRGSEILEVRARPVSSRALQGDIVGQFVQRRRVVGLSRICHAVPPSESGAGCNVWRPLGSYVRFRTAGDEELGKEGAGE